MERHIMTPNNRINGQLELGFNGIPAPRLTSRREGRIARANWWFARMREAVAQAMEPAGQPHPEQIWMPGANRQIKF